jgi:hypothetical protein
MKVAATILIATTALVSSVAFAQSAPDTNKTRAQVRAELVAAERDGLIPVSNVDYPPGADTVARNQADFARTEKFEQNHPHFVVAGVDKLIGQ